MSKDLKTMTKKELKDYINANGFFFHIQCDKINADQVGSILTDASKGKVVNTGREIPTGENIVVFKGIASQNYKAGEKSRNGYKYDQNGWDFSAYVGNPIILWQHDTPYGGIGNAIAFFWDGAGNLNTIFFVDLDTLEERNAVQVRRGYVTAISTGAIAKEYQFEENDTGTMYTESDAEEKFGWENVWEALRGCSDVLTLVVTAAEMIENSLVTIGSNENAIAMQNAIGKHFQEYAETYKKDKIKTDSAEAAPEAPETAAEQETAKETEGTAEEATAEVETPAEAQETSEQDTTTEGTTEASVETSEETPTPAEQAGDEAEETPPTPADENEAKLADALEQIAKLESRISELHTTQDAFKEEVYDTLKDFISAHNDAIENLEQVNSALGSIRVSKGLPYVRSETVDQNSSPLAGLVRTLKGTK